TDVWSDRHLKLSNTVVSFVNRDVTPRFCVPLRYSPGNVRGMWLCRCLRFCYQIYRPGTSGVERAASKENESVPVTKKRETWPRDKDQEEMMMEWLNESSESDSDNIDWNFIAESNHDSASEQEGSDSELAEEPEIEEQPSLLHWIQLARHEIFRCISSKNRFML
ncbi:hypothetical protein WA026_006317, partial [Henosepilachna vigintioctopunctata]